MKLCAVSLLILVAKTEATDYPGTIDQVLKPIPGKSMGNMYRAYGFTGMANYGSMTFVRPQTQQTELPKCSALPKSGAAAWDTCIRDETFNFEFRRTTGGSKTFCKEREAYYGAGTSPGASGGCAPICDRCSGPALAAGPPKPVLCFGLNHKRWIANGRRMTDQTFCYPLPNCDLKVDSEKVASEKGYYVEKCPAGMKCCSNEPPGLYMKLQNAYRDWSVESKIWSYCYRSPDVQKCAVPTPMPTTFPTPAPTKDVPIPCANTRCEIRDGSTVVMGEAPEGEKWHCSNEGGGCKCMCHDTFACTIEHHAGFGRFKKMNHCSPLRTA